MENIFFIWFAIAELVIFVALACAEVDYEEQKKKGEKILCTMARFLALIVFSIINYKILFG